MVRQRTESSWGADDDTLLSLELLGQVDLVSGGSLDQDVEVGQRVTGLDESSSSVVEECPLRTCTREGGGETSGCEHDVFWETEDNRKKMELMGRQS